MTAKAQRRAKNRNRRQRRAAPASVDEADLPGFLRQLRRQAQSVDRYLGDGQDLASAEAAALDDLRAAARRVAELAEPFDAFDVLEFVRSTQAPDDAETYSESEHEGLAAVVEFVALVLVARGQRAALSLADDGSIRADVHPLEEIADAARAGVDAGSMVVMLRSWTDQPDAASLVQAAVLREVFVRNLSYPHMVDDTLDGLFDDPSIDAACRSALGVTVGEIRAVFAAIVEAQIEARSERFASANELFGLVSGELERQTSGGEADADGWRVDEVDPEVRTRARALFTEAFSDPSAVSILVPDDLAGRAGIDRAVVEQVVDLFVTDMETTDPAAIVEGFFEGRSPFRTNPILRADDGSATVVDPVLLTPSVRERVEAGLKGTSGWSGYVKRRGDYLEDRAMALLSGAFPGADVRSGFEYFIPEPGVSPAQQDPPLYTKVVEGDGLLVIDDVAIVVEAKAGALTPLARTGDANRLGSDLRKIVTDAAKQADRMRDRILTDGGLRFRDGSWLDLGHVREVHTIAVSLEDLSGIETVTSHLVGAGLLPSQHLPWTVSLHDLRIVCELTERPAELLLYLRRRTEPDVTRVFHAVDELDFFLEFYSTGLFVEPDPERVEAELPQLGEQPVAAKRRFKKRRLTFLASRTDVLDAYYFHQLGLRATPASKPSHTADPSLVRLVDALASDAAPGWLSMGATLLDAAGPVQRVWGRHGADMVKTTREDGRAHSVTAVGGRRANDSFVIAWVSRAPQESRRRSSERLQQYIAAKKHQIQVARGFGMLFDETRSDGPVATAFDNRIPGPDAELDAATNGLRPLERSGRALPPRATRTRRGRV